MKWFLRGIGLLSMAVSLVSSPKAWGAEYPQVVNLRKFSIETNYMSHPGYLRYLTFVEQGVWISRKEAVAIVREQAKTTAAY